MAPLIKRVAGPHLVDLLWHLPFSILDRRLSSSINAARIGTTATFQIRVAEHRPSLGRGRPYRIHVIDSASGALNLVYFKLPGGYLQKLLPVGEERIISGRLESYNGFLQMAHPDLVARIGEVANIGTLHPVYRSTAGLPPLVLENAIHAAIDKAPMLEEWNDSALVKREGWPSWQEALQIVHAPKEDSDLLADTPARRRLAYDEILASQLTLGLLRETQKRQRGQSNVGNGELRRKARLALPFALTGSQEQALAEINRDMASDRRMLRLLQGDVGSGKTIVALLAMLAAVEAGGQAALMAPTEILAKQHWSTIEPFCRAIGIEAALLVGQGRGHSRIHTLGGLAEGRIPIVVGTHALVQDSVSFRDLRLAVIDEQHRFGVDNRLDLAAKGKSVDTLLMSATPIPRTLTLTAYGDMDVSRLTEKPPGRQPIDTRAIPLDRLDEVLAGIGRRIAAGARVYWVCPLVEESEISDYAAAKQRSITLAAIFGAGKVGLVHGRLKSAEKNAVMEAFARGDLSILVATTVIEVGVDVPEATIMVIEHAERYGLAQLHQLRGRVGRGKDQSTCLLLYTPRLGEIASERLRIIRQSEDGFYLAEEDLRLRGPGEVLGTKQSGLPEFRLVDPAAHLDLIEIAHADARVALERDPGLQSSRGQALRTLLYLFERDQAVRYLRSG